MMSVGGGESEWDRRLDNMLADLETGNNNNNNVVMQQQVKRWHKQNKNTTIRKKSIASLTNHQIGQAKKVRLF